MQEPDVREPDVRIDDALKNAYRKTFGEYACKLDALQRLMDSAGPGNGGIETAMREVESARQAHSAARDRLAQALAASKRNFPPGEDRTRETAQMLWELAGRPQGTAEFDWQRAEQLIRASAVSS